MGCQQEQLSCHTAADSRAVQHNLMMPAAACIRLLLPGFAFGAAKYQTQL
jgi:hypothetical protein